MTKSAIEYCDEGWPIVTGCSHSGSPGCDNCWAARLAATRLKHHRWYGGLAEIADGRARWRGEVRGNADLLNEPYKWRKPRTVFVAPTGDLFHERVPPTFLKMVFSSIILTPNCRFIVLTKRPENMSEFFTSWKMGVPPNVILMVTAENQEWADKRIPVLLEIPAAMHGVSLEPLLGPVDLKQWLYSVPPWLYTYSDRLASDQLYGLQEPMPKLDWVIVGGESGPNARPMHPDWVRKIRDDCVAAGVPFYFKQWHKKKSGRLLDGELWEQKPEGLGG